MRFLSMNKFRFVPFSIMRRPGLRQVTFKFRLRLAALIHAASAVNPGKAKSFTVIV
jgi:hypothetical protein